jgi:hypothetical protein
MVLVYYIGIFLHFRILLTDDYMNKARKKYISVQGFPTVPSLFFLPILAHFIGIFCKTPLSHHILVKHC